MSKVLFIGGEADGQRMEVSGEARRRIRIQLASADFSCGPDVGLEEIRISAEDYRLETLATPFERYSFYVSEGMSNGAAIMRLLENYHPNEP